MGRAKRIFSHGWTGSALNAFTAGYYPAADVVLGERIVFITFAFAKRTMAFSFAKRTMEFEFIGNEPG